ncbi:MAG: type II secretion system F family protein [Syntrophaceticus schinkii]|jgi:tight adherence protein B|nr:type II secretion system F family protein [Syntrophaceticus schinkii]
MILALIFTFTATLLFIMGIYGLISGDRHQLEARLLRYTRQNPPDRSKVPGEKKDMGRSLLRWGGRFFAAFKLSDRVEERLAQADFPLRGEEFLFLILVLTVGFPLLLILLTGNLRIAIFCGLIACMLPWIHLNIRRQKRLQLLNSQLADSLGIMTNALRAGYSFLQGMEMVAAETPHPLAGEYKRALREMQLGTPTEVALNNMSRRVGSDDLELVITAILTQRQVGGNLAEILSNIAGTIRERVRIKGEIKTLTAQGRISGLIIGLLPVVLLALLLVINPGYIGMLFTEPIGIALLGGSACGEVIGVLIIKRIVNIEV